MQIGKPAETGGTTKVTGGTGSAGSDTEPPRPKLPDVTYGGYNFRFYSWDIDGWRVYNDIFVDDPTGQDSISQKVYERNTRIEDKYDINITETREYYSKYAYIIQQNTQSGDDYADVLISHGWIIPAIYAFNPFYNLRDINYLEFNMPWWDDNATESLTIDGFLPTGVSDLTLLDKSATYVVFRNPVFDVVSLVQATNLQPYLAFILSQCTGHMCNMHNRGGRICTIGRNDEEPIDNFAAVMYNVITLTITNAPATRQTCRFPQMRPTAQGAFYRKDRK